MEGYFDSSAATYDKKQFTDADFNDVVCGLACELCGIPKEGNGEAQPFHVLDVGAGTGALSLRLLGVDGGNAPSVPPPVAVCAVDLSREMLAVLRNKASAAGVGADRICTVHADLCAEGGAAAAVVAAEAGQGFDAACSALAMHHMSDVGACVRAVFALLRPGARAAFFDLLREPHTPLFHPAAKHAFVTRHGLAPEELEAWFRDAGFVDVRAWRCAEFSKECVDAPPEDAVRIFGVVVVTGTKPL